jgi:hypothetical protein
MIIESLTTLALIPGLCPFDDIIIWLLFPAVGVWLLKKFKWCKRSCKCDCHPQKRKLTFSLFQFPPFQFKPTVLPEIEEARKVTKAINESLVGILKRCESKGKREP